MKKILVLSGKGGVGKSFASAMLAIGLSKEASTGLLDADVTGPNLPGMLGLEGKVLVSPENKMVPLEKNLLRVMSIGFLLPQDSPVMWRGPLIGKAFNQLLNDTEWNSDFLVIDMPPGTGDIVMNALASGVDGAVLVMTPQKVVLEDVRRTLKLVERFNIPLLGIVENMSYVQCPDGTVVEPFGKTRQDEFPGTTFVRLPLDASLSELMDSGRAFEAYDLVKDAFNPLVKRVLELGQDE